MGSANHQDKTFPALDIGPESGHTQLSSDIICFSCHANLALYLESHTNGQTPGVTHRAISLGFCEIAGDSNSRPAHILLTLHIKLILYCHLCNLLTLSVLSASSCKFGASMTEYGLDACSVHTAPSFSFAVLSFARISCLILSNSACMLPGDPDSLRLKYHLDYNTVG